MRENRICNFGFLAGNIDHGLLLGLSDDDHGDIYIPYSSLATDVYTLDTASITLTAGILNAAQGIFTNDSDNQLVLKHDDTYSSIFRTQDNGRLLVEPGNGVIQLRNTDDRIIIVANAHHNTAIPEFDFRTSKGDTETRTAVAAGRVLGRYSLSGYDGVAGFVTAAQITATVQGTVGEGVVPADLNIYVTEDDGSFTEVLRLDHDLLATFAGDVKITGMAAIGSDASISTNTILGVSGTNDGTVDALFRGVAGEATFTRSASGSLVRGLDFTALWKPASPAGAITLTNVDGASVIAEVQNDTAQNIGLQGTIGVMTGIRALVELDRNSSGTLTAPLLAAFYANTGVVSGGAVATNLYAFYDKGQTAGTNNWGIGINTTNNYISGGLSIGKTTAPAVPLDVVGAITATGAITGGTFTDGVATLNGGDLTGLGSLVVDNLTLDDDTIISDSGAVEFGDDNIITTGYGRFDVGVGIGVAPASTQSISISKSFSTNASTSILDSPTLTYSAAGAIFTGIRTFPTYTPASLAGNVIATRLTGFYTQPIIASKAGETHDITLTSMYGYRSGLSAGVGGGASGAVDVTTGYHFIAENAGAAGGATYGTNYAFYDAGQTAATTDWGLGINTQSYINASLSVNKNTVPTAPLDVAGKGIFTDTGGEQLSLNYSGSELALFEVTSTGKLLVTLTNTTFQLRQTDARAVICLDSNHASQIPQLDFQTSNGTTASKTAVAANRGFGQITMSGWDGNSFEVAAKIVATVKGTVADGQVPCDMGLFVTIDDGTLTEALRLDHDLLATFFGATEIRGDTYWVGAGTGIPYGEFHGDEISFVTAGGTGSFTEVADADIAGGLTNLATFQNNKEIVVTNAGVYKVSWAMSAAASGANKHIVAGIGVDAGGAGALTIQAKGKNHVVSVGNVEFALSGTALLDLSANSEVGLMVSNITDNTDITVQHVNFVISMKGGT